MREQIIELLQKVKSGVDYEVEKDLIGSGILSSLKMLSFIRSLEDEFDISITADYLLPENFMNLDTIENLVNTLSDED